MNEIKNILILFLGILTLSILGSAVLVSTYNDVSDAQEIVKTTYDSIRPVAEDLGMEQRWITLMDRIYAISIALFLIMKIFIIIGILNRILHSVH